MSDTTRFLSQTVDYLGFLQAKLRDLHGIATLVYELVQNADDVKDEQGQPAATQITFDVTEAALLVENDGRFRPIDFERLRHLASGSKRAEAETSGAFGLGFLAVFQVTDAPEIFSSGKRWVIRPEAAATERILQQETATEGTLFRLPWAVRDSAVRRVLQLQLVEVENLSQLTADITAALSLAAIFLKQLRVLQVKQNGVLVQRIEREWVGEETLRLHQGNVTHTWHLWRGDFAASAAALRQTYSWHIEEKRRSQVWLAIPETPLSNGRLFATLPSQSHTPLPFHLNSDFFPSNNRKQIIFGSDYQSAWNRAAVKAAAQQLVARLGELPALIGAAGLWHFFQQVMLCDRQAKEGVLDDVFANFWQMLTPLLPHQPVLFTSVETWVNPAHAFLTTSEAETAATPLLETLQIPLVHPVLRPYAALLRQPEVGVPLLRVAQVTAALNQHISHDTPLNQAPPPFNHLAAWQTLWRLCELLLRRAPTRAEHEQDILHLQTCPLTFTSQGTLVPAVQVVRGRAESRHLFPRLLWLHETLSPDTVPGSLTAELDVRRALLHLNSFSQTELETAWQRGELDTTALYEWFESRQWQFVEDTSLKQPFRRLPLFPVFDQLYSLVHVYIPGGFDDPLKLSGIVDLTPIGGRTDFLRDMGAQPLSFAAYLSAEVPRILRQYPDLRSDARHELVQLIAKRFGEIREDEEMREILRPLPLVACLDGHFRPADQVYANRQVTAVLGEQAHIAEPATPAVHQLYEWLGVVQTARPADLLRFLQQVSEQFGRFPLDETTCEQVQNSWQLLGQFLAAGHITPAILLSLQQKRCIPAHSRQLQSPDTLFFADNGLLIEKFPAAIYNFLLPASQLDNAALRAVGVRPFSQVVQQQLLHPTQAEADTFLAERVRQRLLLLRRVSVAEGGTGDTAVLQSLRFLRLPHLTVEYRVVISGEVYHTALEQVSAIFQAAENTFYTVHDEKTVPWAVIGRILASLLKPIGTTAGLASGIKEVMACPHTAEASRLLDELGYPALK